MDGEKSSDMFLPLTFGVHHSNGTKTCLFEQTFGKKAMEFAALKVEKAEMQTNRAGAVDQVPLALIITIIIVVVIIVIIIIAVKMQKKGP